MGNGPTGYFPDEEYQRLWACVREAMARRGLDACLMSSPETVDRAGLAGYRRHHCGYSVGIGFPPSWSGGGVPVGLRRGSDLELRPGMVFHLLSWLLETTHGSAFVSDAVVVTQDGCERLTSARRDLTVR